MSTDARGRFVAILAVGLLPWTVLISARSDATAVDLVFAWGLVAPADLHAVLLSTYLFDLTRGLPDYLLAWPTSAALYAAALAGALVGLATGREDRRLTAGLLVLAGVGHLGFALGVGRTHPADLVVPVGPILLWTVAWWFDRAAFRIVPATAPQR